jgi:serine/threonine protein kinase/Tfp pilus assembly protein PilF
MSNSDSARNPLDELADEFVARHRRGEQPALTEYTTRFPDLADEIREVFPALILMEEARHYSAAAGGATGDGRTVPPAPAPERLNEYRILREVGRGGMGIVYEAEQESLGRRVALKVLPFAAALDPRQLQRFQNEAHAAAQLHHQNIVPVYGVGSDRGVHYYAMQFINGRTLDDLVRELRRLEGLGRDEKPPAPPSAADPEQTGPYTGPPLAATPSPAATTTPPAAALSTERSRKAPGFVRTVAQLGVQAAEALEHAHQLGIVHRDIKPANLMVDVRGNLWVTDFGLAHVQSDTRLTVTGDLIGTLRYMSPEQALGRRVAIDQRTDVYSLGVTLYELLTLEHAFDGRTREELLRQISVEDPRPPRKHNKAIPPELETIILKAVAKNPAERYATAQELADDLRRFLEDRPVQARRPTLLQRARKWARRHRPAVWAACTVFLIMGLALGGVWLSIVRGRADTERRVGEALREATRLREQEQYPEALAEAKKAEAVLEGGWGSAALRRRVDRQLVELRLARDLEDIHVPTGAGKEAEWDYAWRDAAYARAFRGFDIDVENLPRQEAAARIRAAGIRSELLIALDEWASLRRHLRGLKDPSWKHIRAVARAADDSDWRNRFREGIEREDREANAALVKMADSNEIAGLPTRTQVLLALVLRDANADAKAVALLRKAHQRHPGDFWVNHTLAELLQRTEPHSGKALRYYAAAAALRPRSSGACNNFATALAAVGEFDEAIVYHRRALELNKDNESAHNNLGLALMKKGLSAAAVPHFREALRLFVRDSPIVRANLSQALARKGARPEELKEAETHARKAIALARNYSHGHHSLGTVFLRRGEPARAIEHFARATKLDAKEPASWANLGQAYLKTEQWEKALRAFDEAGRRGKDGLEFHHNRGHVLHRLGRFDEAAAAYRTAVLRDSKSAESHLGLGLVLLKKRQTEESLAAFRQALRLDPDLAEAHLGIGEQLIARKSWDEALAAYQQALRIHKKAPLLPKRLAEVHRHVGVVHLELRDLDEAAGAFRQAMKIDPGVAQDHYNLGVVLAAAQDPDAAVAAYEKALTLDPNDPDVYCNLSASRIQQGRFADALKAARQAVSVARAREVDLGPPEAAVKKAEAVLALDRKLANAGAGPTLDLNLGQTLKAAHLLACKRWYVTSVHASKVAFDAEREAARAEYGHRFRAACAAAQAGCGRAEDPRPSTPVSAKGRFALRQMAFVWLRADLEYWAGQARSLKPQDRRAAAQALRLWQRHPRLAVVRDAAALAALPAGEREEWRQLWTDVARALD